MPVATFEKVGLGQFMQDWINTYGNRPDHIITEIYAGIIPPERKTRYSAGHDFHMPYRIEVDPGQQAMIPTGIKCKMDNEFVMVIFPRSSLGIKKHMFISNTVPVVDADYYNNVGNEGHIFICIENHGTDQLIVGTGEAFAQAIFVKYGTADNGAGVKAERAGGIGSTTK